MRNPARLAADLAGRPLLLREAAVPGLARLLGVEGGERRSHLSTFFGRARQLFRGAEDGPCRDRPEAYAPAWLGAPEDQGFGWSLRDGVGCVLIDTPLMAEGFGWGDSWYHGYDTLLRAWEEMVADARVRAIFAVYDTPGGVVDAGLPELARFMREHREDAGGKPVHAFARAAYSAGYWLLSQSDQALGAREGGVGSIGAVVTHCDLSGLLEQDGIRVTSFNFGARKTDGSPWEPLSDTAAASLQAEIDQCGRWFVADVLAGRPSLTEAAVLATEAGCFFVDADDPALSGRAQGLVDQVRTEREAFAALARLAEARPTSFPAAHAASAAPKETEMKRSDVLAAARKAGLSEDSVRKLSAELPEDDAPPAEEEGAEDEEDMAEDDEPAEAESGAEDEEADDDGVDPKAAKAILALPEAKGREPLAQELALTPGMTADRARALLAKAEKANPLAQRMSGRDPNVARSGGASRPAGDFEAGKALGDRLAALNGRARRRSTPPA